MNNRLKQFLAAENISQSQFADTIKVVRATVSHILAGRNKPGYDFIKAIMLAYPRLNMEWMIMGKGKMYKAEEDTTPAPSHMPESPFMPAEDELPLLFGYEPSEAASVEAPELEPHPATEPYPVLQQAAPSSIKESINTSQFTNKQRKAIKIAVFYDDGTYQEFLNQ